MVMGEMMIKTRNGHTQEIRVPRLPAQINPATAGRWTNGRGAAMKWISQNMVAALLKTIPEVKGIMVFLPSLVEVVSIQIQALSIFDGLGASGLLWLPKSWQLNIKNCQSLLFWEQVLKILTQSVGNKNNLGTKLPRLSLACLHVRSSFRLCLLWLSHAIAVLGVSFMTCRRKRLYVCGFSASLNMVRIQFAIWNIHTR